MSIARLAPYVQRREDLQVCPTAQQPMDNEQIAFDDAESEVVVDEQMVENASEQQEREPVDDRYSDEEERAARDSVPKTAPMRTRPLRAGRKPA